jgi:endogenous inhibitor of DNA gyrase (YacG/DUF329 family)
MPESADSKGCPVCGKPVEERWRPFCSKRCADVDLHRWLSGRYAVPVVENEDDVTTVPKPGDDPGDR